MDVTRKIQVAVAWADLILCRTAQVLAVVMLAALLLTLVWCVKTYCIEPRYDPYLIDYDAPGVDITSEGPDDGDPWFTNGGDDL